MISQLVTFDLDVHLLWNHCTYRKLAPHFRNLFYQLSKGKKRERSSYHISGVIHG